jgi:hypothetical protein
MKIQQLQVDTLNEEQTKQLLDLFKTAWWSNGRFVERLLNLLMTYE